MRKVFSKNPMTTAIKNANGAATLAFCSGLLINSVVSAPAALAEGLVVEEVVVTARKRDESLSDVPMAVSAISGTELEKFGTTDIRDLEAQSPGVLINSGGSGAGGTIAIRGLSTDPAQFGFEQSVSISVDGVQVGRARGVMATGMMDVNQVEVMKGPQALFFGKNSPGGVISLKTRNPGDVVEGYLKGGFETEANEYKYQGALSVPINDELKSRYAFAYRDMEGWLKDTQTRTLNEDEVPPGGLATAGVPTKGNDDLGEEEFLGRVTLQYFPIESAFDATLKVSYVNYEDAGFSKNNQIADCGTESTGVIAPRGNIASRDPFGNCKIDDKTVQPGLPDGVADNWKDGRQNAYSEMENWLVTLDMNYQFDYWTMTAVTGIYDSDYISFDNVGYTSAAAVFTSQGEKYELLSQEIRFSSEFEGRVNYMAGIYVSEADLEVVGAPMIAQIPQDAETGKYHSWEKTGTQEASTQSVFAQVLADLTDTLELAFGARWTAEEKDSTLGHDYAHPILVGGPAAVSPSGKYFSDTFDDENISPEATLTWRPTYGMTVYAGYKTGYKSGGAALGATLTGYDPNLSDEEYLDQKGFSFGAEEIDGFEVGMKSKWLDDKLTLNVAAYSYDYSDLQVSAFDADTTSFIVKNAAEATVEGIEVDANFLLNANTRVYGSVSYNNAEYDDYITSCSAAQTDLGANNYPGCMPGADGQAGTQDDVQDLSGKSLPRAPEYSGNLGIDYAMDVSTDWELSFNFNARYSDEYGVAANGDPRAVQDSFWVYDSSVRLAEIDGGYHVSLVGRNLTEEWYSDNWNDKPLQNVGQFVGNVRRGRQIYLEFGYSF